MSRYSEGRAFEYATRQHLRDEGYWTMRAASSKGKADLIAIKPGQFLVVQCKRNGKISPDERAEVVRIAAMIDGGIPVVAWKQLGKAEVLFDRLTGIGAKDRVAFLTDEVPA